MAGGILQLVANTGAVENIWINGDPQITFFKCIYRRHTPFATEMVPIRFNSKINFGGSASLIIPRIGDLVYRTFFVLDIPKLAATFINTKSQDLYKIIKNTIFTDSKFNDQLKKLVTNEFQIEFDRILNLINQTFNDYEQEEIAELAILDAIEKYRDPVNIYIGNNSGIVNNIYNPELETDSVMKSHIINNYSSYDFTKFKINLTDQFVNQKKQYYLIYELLKFIYLSEKEILEKTPLVNPGTIVDRILYENVFKELLPNKEIQLAHRTRIKSNKDIFSNNVIRDFDYDFHCMLSIYNSIIIAVRRLAETVPIIVSKAFNINANYDIYIDAIVTPIGAVNYQTIVDPNFKNIFLSEISGPFPATFENAFAQLFNDKANIMFNSIKRSIEYLFETYRLQLFTSTNKLFFNNSAPLSNIYGYIVPTNGYLDNANLRIKNVFNANIWYFYFFKYLDYLDESIFSEYISDNFLTSELSVNGIEFLKYLITLLKINIEYYMYEISYLLNDLYASAPSINPLDSMKNYVPIAHNTLINGINIQNDLLAITLIFHRSHVPSIIEMFEYIRHFISTVELGTINKNLNLELSEISTAELVKIRLIANLLYDLIFKHFADKYNQTSPDNPFDIVPNYSNLYYVRIVGQYVRHFVVGDSTLQKKYSQLSIFKTLAQMEFYFIAEMINMRQQQNFFSTIFDKKIIEENVGHTGSEIIELINKILFQYPNYQTLNVNRFNGQSYLDTAYLSRNYNFIDNLPLPPPIPLPPTMPFGINPAYYNHNQLLNSTEIPVYWITANDNNLLLAQNDYLNSSLDYFRIRHDAFFHIPNASNNIKFVDDFHYNLLRLLKLTEYLDENFSTIDKNLLVWIQHALSILISSPSSNSIINLLSEYSDYIIDSIDKNYNNFPPDFLSGVLNILSDLTNEMLVSVPFTSDDLLASNILIHNIITSGNSNQNIINTLQMLRDNFISQYFYYVLYGESIRNISMIDTDFTSLSQIYRTVLTSTNINNLDLSVLDRYQENVFLYPQIYPIETNELVELHNELDDFSQYISKLLADYLLLGSPSNLTELDIYDIINQIFIAVREIYSYCLSCQQFDYVANILEKYQKLLLDKLMLFSNIMSLVYKKSSQQLTLIDLDSIARLAEKNGIDYEAYYNYLTNLLNFNNKSLNHFIIQIKTDLDYFLSGSDISYKNQIINEIFTPEYIVKHPNLEQYFKFVDNDYYPYIYFFMIYAKKNNLMSKHIKNPLMLLIQSVVHSDRESIINHYDGFTHVSDLLKYFMDHVLDCAGMICESNYADERFSSIINSIHKSKRQFLYQKNIDIENEKKNMENFVMNNDRIQTIIRKLDKSTSVNALDKILNSIGKDNSNDELYFDELNERNEIIELVKNTIKKEIILLQQQKKELKQFKARINNILYRNSKAKTAWIRKLAHYLIKEVTLKNDDQTINIHISDWLESYHEISKHQGVESGYLKMIGHRKDLIVYDDKVKNSYTIVMPLVFYFNKDPALSLPLTASINTKYQIGIKLRNLDDVAYKEEFSVFVDPDSDFRQSEPSITNAYLMIEYIYLASEERNLFVKRRLEYLIDEVQYDNNFNIADNNLVPIYKIGTIKRTKTVKKNGVKTKQQYYDTNKGVYIDKALLDSTSYSTDLIPRNDYILSEYQDRSGIIKKMMIYKPLPNVNPYVHKKRIELKNYFAHPSKLMIVLVKPLIHTELSYRTDENSYFFGEKQWDNYGLYAYYDLSKITKAKEEYYQQFTSEINDLENPIFGFANIINQLLLNYCELDKKVLPDGCTGIGLFDDNKWINENYDYFLQIIQTIKDAYNNFHEEILNKTNSIRLKENILSLAIDYHIFDLEILMQMTVSIYDKLQIEPDANLILNIFDRENRQSFTINKNMFRDNLTILLSKYSVLNPELHVHLEKLINETYNNYNDLIVNLIVNSVNHLININDLEYNLINIITYFDFFYFAQPNLDKNIVAALTQIKNQLHLMTDTEINNLNTNTIKNLTYKDVIIQVLSPINLTDLKSFRMFVPYNIIQIVSSKMQEKQNQIVNNHYVNLISYPDNMIKNPIINPLLSGYLKFNSYNIMPENSVSIMWSEAKAYQYTTSTPSTGINMHSWSLDPLAIQPQGSANLSKIDKFNSVYEVHPLISNEYPAVIVTMVLNINIMRYLSGMCGKAWELKNDFC